MSVAQRSQYGFAGAAFLCLVVALAILTASLAKRGKIAPARHTHAILAERRD